MHDYTAAFAFYFPPLVSALRLGDVVENNIFRIT